MRIYHVNLLFPIPRFYEDEFYEDEFCKYLTTPLYPPFLRGI